MQVRINEPKAARVRELSKAVNTVRKTSNTALVDEVLHHGLSAMEKKYLKKK
jgi:hypothetical protein